MISAIIQSTIAETLKSRMDQRARWLLDGLYIVLNGHDRGRAFIRSLGNEEADQKESLRGWLEE